MSKQRLALERQCQKCPWKISTNPHEIPKGYCVKKHRGLKKTIADPGSLCSTSGAMACHESKPGKESYCIGWLANQMGSGNNIGLRMKMMSFDLSRVKLDGPQHQTFEDTLP